MFYVLFGPLFLVPRRMMPRLLGGWFLAAAFCSFIVRPPERAYLMPLSPYTLEFLLGCLAAVTLRKTGTKYWSLALVTGTFWGVAGIALNITGIVQTASAPVLRLLCFGVPAALNVRGLASRETGGVTTLPRWLRPLGDASYSIYLTHIAVLWGFQFCGAYAVVWSLLVQTLLILAGKIIVACSVGWIIHRTVERPLLEWNRRSKGIDNTQNEWNIARFFIPNWRLRRR